LEQASHQVSHGCTRTDQAHAGRVDQSGAAAAHAAPPRVARADALQRPALAPVPLVGGRREGEGCWAVIIIIIITIIIVVVVIVAIIQQGTPPRNLLPLRCPLVRNVGPEVRRRKHHTCGRWGSGRNHV
jgi:hypothetical protein